VKIDREGLYDRNDTVARGGRQVKSPRYTLPIFLIVSASITMTKIQAMGPSTMILVQDDVPGHKRQTTLVLQKMIGLSNLSSQCVDRCGRLYQRRRVVWGVSVDIITSSN
jgi:hypothetical protein